MPTISNMLCQQLVTIHLKPQKNTTGIPHGETSLICFKRMGEHGKSSCRKLRAVIQWQFSNHLKPSEPVDVNTGSLLFLVSLNITQLKTPRHCMLCRKRSEMKEMYLTLIPLPAQTHQTGILTHYEKEQWTRAAEPEYPSVNTGFIEVLYSYCMTTCRKEHFSAISVWWRTSFIRPNPLQMQWLSTVC